MILVKNNQKLIGSPGCIQGNLFFLVDLTIHFLQCVGSNIVKGFFVYIVCQFIYDL